MAKLEPLLPSAATCSTLGRAEDAAFEPVSRTSEVEAEIRRQVLVGRRNRLVAQLLEELWSAGKVEVPPGEYFCTCGRTDCDEILVLTLDEYRFVRGKPHRFVVAPGHARTVHEVMRCEDGYDVVEIVPNYRHLVPLPGETDRGLENR